MTCFSDIAMFFFVILVIMRGITSYQKILAVKILRQIPYLSNSVYLQTQTKLDISLFHVLV